MLECEHSFHIEKLVVVTYEAAVQSVRTAIKPGFELYPCMLTLSLLLD